MSGCVGAGFIQLFFFFFFFFVSIPSFCYDDSEKLPGNGWERAECRVGVWGSFVGAWVYVEE